MMSREMRHSGIDWIGEIPKEWKLATLKQIGTYINGYAFKPEDWTDSGKPIIRIQDLTGSMGSPNFYNGELDSKYLVNKGDILVSWAATLDAFIWEKEEGWLNQHIFKALPSSDVNYQFFYWLIKLAMENMNNDNKHGIVMQHVTTKVFGNFAVCIPSVNEQQKIANYLDKACGEVDEMIALQEQMIEELKAYKQSVITEAVTKGLNPDVPMKDSGIDWIGEVPEHWRFIKMRGCVDSISDVDHYMPESVEKGIPYIMTRDLSDRTSSISFDQCKQISDEDYLALSRKVVVKRNDIIYARYATIGTVCIVDTDDKIIVSYSCVIIKTSKKLDSNFLFYYLKSKTFEEEALQFINTNIQGNLGIDSLYRTRIILPPLSEQQTIASYLDTKCSEIDALIAIKQAKIEELKEYKKSVIYEYVTGKKEVGEDLG